MSCSRRHSESAGEIGFSLDIAREILFTSKLDDRKRLREILAGLEKEDLSLEESFAGYEEGVRLVRYCSSRIDDVEKKVQKMNEDGSLEDF